ncbi:MAG: hypothetical protein Q7R96_04215 [Nanoarchaeota archaeon]|nr:hypothetical protein [Nanoarchaeota archaeon]
MDTPVYELTKYRVLTMDEGSPSIWLYQVESKGFESLVINRGKLSEKSHIAGSLGSIDLVAKILSQQPDILNARIVQSSNAGSLHFNNVGINQIFRQQLGVCSEDEMLNLGRMIIQYTLSSE